MTVRWFYLLTVYSFRLWDSSELDTGALRRSKGEDLMMYVVRKTFHKVENVTISSFSIEDPKRNLKRLTSL